MKIDARGLSCPEPVILLRRALENKPDICEISVDNAAARENCARYAKYAGYKTEIIENDGGWTLRLTK
ncbi:MAG TPA: preprotein translocase subunit TatB [Clostridiales bacterium]|nr:preprotein translocase subunit TatB [Clostridiales bacterium]